MVNNTVKNFGSGIFGTILVFVAFVFLFVNFWLALAIFIYGVYLKYKSNSYVHQ